MPRTGVASASRCTIPTLLERKGTVIIAFAFCPVCDKVEESNGEGHGQQHALKMAAAKIHEHLSLVHRVF